jgi:putative transposase
MSDHHALTPQEQGALVRYSAVSYLQQVQEGGQLLAEALRQAAARPWPDTQSGKLYAIRTLEDWWYAYQNDGFQALITGPRRDAGKRRKLTAQQQEWILEQRQTYPHIPVKVAYRLWLKQPKGKELPSLSTVYRFLRESGLPARGRASEDNASNGPTKAFEAPYPNDLWMVDFSPGPKLITASGKLLSTQLCAVIDDHSRLIPYAAYYFNENTQNFHHALKEAIRRRGLPHKLYADNGAPFISKHTHIVCANLGIRLLHHKPYRAWSKGKIERVFSSIQLGFETTLCLPENHINSLEELNAKFSTWLQTDYHTRQHSSTGTSPQARFQAGAEHLRQLELSATALEKLFHTRIQRTVRKNGVIRIDNQLYEVDLSLRGRRIELRYDPFAAAAEPDIYHQGHYIGQAKVADLQLNSQLDYRRDYQDRRRS